MVTIITYGQAVTMVCTLNTTQYRHTNPYKYLDVETLQMSYSSTDAN